MSDFVGRAAGRLSEGWRRDIAGAELDALLSGDRVIRFESGQLSLLPFESES